MNRREFFKMAVMAIAGMALPKAQSNPDDVWIETDGVRVDPSRFEPERPVTVDDNGKNLYFVGDDTIIDVRMYDWDNDCWIDVPPNASIADLPAGPVTVDIDWDDYPPILDSAVFS